MDVRLPLSTADLDALTAYVRSSVLRQRRGVRTARIYYVRPWRVEACRDVTFLIEGSDLWRDPKVYFQGRRTEQVEVLPDMVGLAATFHLQESTGLAPEETPAKKKPDPEIVVVTRRGTDTYSVPVPENCVHIPPKPGASDQGAGGAGDKKGEGAASGKQGEGAAGGGKSGDAGNDG
jgi:hypothetical protein